MIFLYYCDWEHSCIGSIQSVQMKHYAKALTGCHGLAGSDPHDGGVPSEHWIVAALFKLSMYVHHLINENM